MFLKKTLLILILRFDITNIIIKYSIIIYKSKRFNLIKIKFRILKTIIKIEQKGD